MPTPHADLGFVPDNPHEDLGFVPDSSLPMPYSVRPTQTPGAAERLGSQALGIGSDLLQGVGASAMSIPVGGYNLLRKGIRSLPPMPQMLEDSARPPDTTAGHIGEFAGDLATFTAPGGLEEAAISKLPATGRLTRAGIRAGMDALTAGSVEGVKSGGDPTRTATAAATAGVTGGLLEGVGKPIINAATDLWGKATGAGGEAIRTAYQQQASQGFLDAMRYRKSEQQVVQDLNDAVHDVMIKRGQDYRAAMGQLDQSIRLNPQPIIRELTDQARSFNITPLAGKGKAFMSSPIVQKTDQDAMLRAIGDVTRWTDFSPAGMDTLKQRLTGYADTVSPRAQPFFYRVADAVKRQLGDQVPGYQELTADYSKASELLENTRKELSANAANPGTTMRKLTYIFNQNNEYRKILLESLDDAAGSDLKNTMAGYALRTPIPRGLAGVGAGMLTSTGVYFHSPYAASGALFASPRVAGETMALLSILRRSRVPGVPASAVAPALANQIVPNELTPPPANLTPPPAR